LKNPAKSEEAVGINRIIEKIRKRQRVEEESKEPLFEDVKDTMPLFLTAALLDSLHDIWRLNSRRLIYRLGVLMGHKLRVELGEKLELEEVGTWEGTVKQVAGMLELFSSKVTIAKVSRLYARIEREGCPCTRMRFSLDFCPQDRLIDGVIAGFAQRTLDDDRILCKYRTCGKEDPKGLCIHELRIKED